mgnify:CR=1 FL=1
MDELVKDLTLDMISEGLYRMITRPVRDARIKKEFTGYNHQELARKYGVTERWVRRICGPGQAEGQIGIFDYLEDPGDEYEDEGPCNS